MVPSEKKNFIFVADFILSPMLILRNKVWGKDVEIKRINFWPDLLVSGRYNISWISQRIYNIFAVKWFLMLERNQLVRKRRLFRSYFSFEDHTTATLASFSLNYELMISFTKDFYSWVYGMEFPVVYFWCDLKCHGGARLLRFLQWLSGWRWWLNFTSLVFIN